MENNAVETELLECDNPAIDYNSVDWASVAMAYKLIRLSPLKEWEERESDWLRRKYMSWFLSKIGSMEFDIALRMVFEDCEAAAHCPAHIGDLLRDTEATAEK